MNITEAMTHHRGPKAVIAPDEGARFTYGPERIAAQLKLAPGQFPQYKFSAVRFDLQPGQSLDLMASSLTARILYCLQGTGKIQLNGDEHPFLEEVFVHLGEGHHGLIRNTGAAEMQVFSFAMGTAPEARLDLATETDPLPHVALDDSIRAAFGLLSLDEAAKLPEDRRGVLVHQLPDTGPSYWQARPSAGWVEVKLAPFTHDLHHYALLMQTLFPGNAVREHAHNQLNEFFVISKGTALAALDGADAHCPKGTCIVIGRNVWHRWGNAGEENAQNFAIIDPPGVEGALSVTGRARLPGTPDNDWPKDIERSPETGRILQERYGFVIREGSADAV